jgi:hypothetical protein
MLFDNFEFDKKSPRQWHRRRFEAAKKKIRDETNFWIWMQKRGFHFPVEKL